MVSLDASLSIASEALNAESGAIGITNNNISNVNTAGYSRQTVNLSAEALAGGADNGVSFGGYTSVRDQLLNIAVNNKTSEQGSLNTQSTALSEINTDFSGTTTGVGAAISTFFTSVSALSSDPSNSSSRQAVLSAATQLSNAFHQGASALTTAQANANTEVSSTVAQINQLAKQIASLNSQLSSAGSSSSSSGQGGGALEDQRDQLTAQLARLTGISETQTEGQPTLTTANGSPLVVGDKMYALQVSTGSDGMQHITDASGADVTATITGGSLGGALTLRDTTVPQFLAKLNTLATQFANAVNSAQAAGYDATGAAGQPMFSVSSTSGTNASAGISVALSAASGVAASSDGSAGSSGNVASLMAVESSALPSGQTPTDTYASLVTTIGSAASDVSAGLNATKLSLQQLTAQQSAVSGVSIDEESTNLIRYQQAYTAAAHVVSTINDLFSVVMNMGTGS